MTLPDGTAIAAAVTFIENIYGALTVFAALFAVVAVMKLGPYILKRFARLLPK